MVELEAHLSTLDVCIGSAQFYTMNNPIHPTIRVPKTYLSGLAGKDG
jgi:hypothetical protein